MLNVADNKRQENPANKPLWRIQWDTIQAFWTEKFRFETFLENFVKLVSKS